MVGASYVFLKKWIKKQSDIVAHSATTPRWNPTPDERIQRYYIRLNGPYIASNVHVSAYFVVHSNQAV